MEQGRKLAQLDVPKVLFLPGDTNCRTAKSECIIPFLRDDLWLWPFYDRIKKTPVHGPNKGKDTHLYHMVQNQKTDWVAQAARLNPFKTDSFLWLDFGIFGLAKGDDAAFAKAIEAACKETVRGVRIPGCVPLSLIKPLYTVDNPLWHFCGSMFAADLAGAVEFDLAAKSVVMDALEEGNLTFEVNNWCVVHHRRPKLFDWYEADHNISMLANFRKPSGIALPSTKYVRGNLVDSSPSDDHYRRKADEVGIKAGPSVAAEVRQAVPHPVQKTFGEDRVPLADTVAALAKNLTTAASSVVEKAIPTYVVIPFKGMHDMTRHLVGLLEAGDTRYTPIFMNNGTEWLYAETACAFQRQIACPEKNIYQMWNLGIAAAVNDAGEPCNVAILNNDLTVGPTFLRDLATALRQPGISVASPRMGEGRTLFEGCAFMLRGEEWPEPPFDEQFEWYYGDSDLQEWLVRCRMKTAIVDTPCEHVGGGSQTPLPNKAAIVERDRQRFLKKWPEQLRERGSEACDHKFSRLGGPCLKCGKNARNLAGVDPPADPQIEVIKESAYVLGGIVPPERSVAVELNEGTALHKPLPVVDIASFDRLSLGARDAELAPPAPRKANGQPLFTVILLSHNKPKFVGQAIESVRTQTFRDFECVVFDSGELYDRTEPAFFGQFLFPMDDRFKMVRSWESEHLRKRKHVPSWALNECFRDGLVKGQWVVYLCDDDVLYPLALQAFADGMKKWPDAQALYAGIDRAAVDDDGTEYLCGDNPVDGVLGKLAGGGSLDGKMDGMQVCHRVSALAKFGNDQWWPEGKQDAWHADGLFLDKLGSMFRIYPVPHKIGKNRKVPGSINTNDSARKRMVEEARRRPSPAVTAPVATGASRNAVQVLPGKRVVLNMIVRNEAKIIERCLKSLVKFIDFYDITDTGSTDGTPEIIENFMLAHGKAGDVRHIPFKSFGETRNAALEMCFGANEAVAKSRLATTADYILLSDADMELVIEDPTIKTHLTEPAYSVIQKVGTLAYPNARLLRADQTKARYARRTHEYLDTPGTTTVPLEGIWFIDHGDGANRPDKARRDAEMLKLDLADMPGDARSMYYLAQSYKEMGQLKEAIEWYDKRATAEGSWDEEAWHAAYQSAMCKLAYGDTNGFVAGVWAAYERRPWRAEPLYHLARFYREKGQNEQCVAVVKVAEGIGYPKGDQLFIEEGVY